MLEKFAIFYRELVRRNVLRVGVLYVLGSWALVEASGELLPMLELPNTSTRIAVLLAASGLPVALVLAWVFQISRQGVIRTGPFSERRYHERRQQKITVPYENRRGERRAAHLLIRIANEHSMRVSGLLGQPVWLLKALDDSVAGQTYRITNCVTLGRDQDCDITLPGTSVSRIHAELLVDTTGVRVRDLDTPNGTYINDVRIDAEAHAGHADVIRLARMRFQLLAPNLDVLKTSILNPDDTLSDS